MITKVSTMVKHIHVQTGLSWGIVKKKTIGHMYNGVWWDSRKLFLTLISIKAPKASVPLGVWVVGVEWEGEAPTRSREEQGIYSGLKLLKFPFATQNRNKVSIWKDLEKMKTGHHNSTGIN